MSNLAKKITLETAAQKSGYERCDIYGQTPSCKECCFGSAPVLQSKLDLLDVNDKINTSAEVQAEISKDAGR